MKGIQRINGALSSIVVATLTGFILFANTSLFASESAAAVTAGQTTNLQCLHILEEVVGLKTAAEAAIEHDDIDGLGKLHATVRTKIRDAQLQMDRAFLTGAWKPSEYKRDAADIMGRLEGVEILNFISLAFLNGYGHPTKKIPASVVDATRKMFVHLDSVTDRMQMLNKSVEAKLRQK